MDQATDRNPRGQTTLSFLLSRERAVVEGPEEGDAADGERSGVGAEHDLVQQLGVDDAVPALSALGIAERGEVLMFVLEMRRTEIHPVFMDHLLDHRPG